MEFKVGSYYRHPYSGGSIVCITNVGCEIEVCPVYIVNIWEKGKYYREPRWWCNKYLQGPICILEVRKYVSNR